MHVPWPAHEYERTCDNCGHVWRVPKELAHPHMQGLPMRYRQGDDPGGRDIIAATEAVVKANAELAERAKAFGRCPKCESDHYRQRTIRS
jgi:DNA-directed RNA polymerase subunit M/transcription elongation factor TFIIS